MNDLQPIPRNVSDRTAGVRRVCRTHYLAVFSDRFSPRAPHDHRSRWPRTAETEKRPLLVDRIELLGSYPGRVVRRWATRAACFFQRGQSRHDERSCCVGLDYESVRSTGIETSVCSSYSVKPVDDSILQPIHFAGAKDRFGAGDICTSRLSPLTQPPRSVCCQ